MLDNALKGLIVGLGCVLAVWGMVAAVKGAKRGRGGAAVLGVLLAVFGSSGPPPHEAMEEARLAKDRNRSGDGDDDDTGGDGGSADGHGGEASGD